MSILTTKKIFFFLVFINLNYILCEKSKCSTIEHCLKCSNENKCDKCEFGYRLNDDDTKCVKSRLIRYGKRRIGYLHNSSSSEENTNSTKFEDIKRQKFVGTAEYMAPEIINSKKTGYYTDMWSLMCILYLCFTGETPFSDKTEYLIFQKITHVKYNEEKIHLIPKEALDLFQNFFKA